MGLMPSNREIRFMQGNIRSKNGLSFRQPARGNAEQAKKYIMNLFSANPAAKVDTIEWDVLSQKL
jgi:hypothetical protein